MNMPQRRRRRSPSQKLLSEQKSVIFRPLRPTRPSTRRRIVLSLVIGLATAFVLAKEPPVPLLTPEQKQGALTQFIAKKKFIEERFYPGATNERDRVRYEAKVNELAGQLEKLGIAEQTKAAVLALFRPTMVEFEDADSEERDRFLQYLEELMGIFGIESSDGLLNKWRYGFDPKEPLEVSNANALAAMTSDEKALFARFEGMTAASALDVMRSVLGPPTTDAGAMRLWHLKPDASSAIGLSLQGGETLFTWLARNRFTYARRL
jgi:Domain of unknown function (DUF4844)